MKETLSRIKKLESDNQGKLRLPALIVKCEEMVKNLINNPRPNRRIEDFVGDDENG